MSWNYRVVEKEYNNEKYFQIMEVYYDDNENIVAFGDAPIPYGDNKEDIKECLNLMYSALDKDIVVYKNYINKD